MPGAGGVTAMNQLGLNIGSLPDGLTFGYFTMSATVMMTDDPVLKIKTDDLVPIAAARGWNVGYARKDIVPGGYASRRILRGRRTSLLAATAGRRRRIRGCAWRSK